MAIEFLKEISRRLSGHYPEPSLFADREPFQTRLLAPRIEVLLAQASAANQDDAKNLYHEAGNEAIAVYLTLGTDGITAEDRILRGRHAEIAVTSFMNAGEVEDAINFGEIALQDPILPEVSKSRIQKALEVSA